MIDLYQLEKTILESEAGYSDLIADTEKHIRWFNPYKRTHYALVYIHGFSATRQEIQPVIDNLADKLKANVFFTRLKGHGRSGNTLTEASLENWITDAQEALTIAQQIGEKVIIVSTSTGATLATWLTDQHDDNPQVFASICMSPNYQVKRKLTQIICNPVGMRLAKWLNGPTNTFEPLNERHQKYWTKGYPLEALLPMFRLLKMVKALDKHRITTPTMMIYDPDDQIIDAKAINKVFKQLPNNANQLVRFTATEDPSRHVLAGDACSPKTNTAITQLMFDFVDSLERDHN